MLAIEKGFEPKCVLVNSMSYNPKADGRAHQA